MERCVGGSRVARLDPPWGSAEDSRQSVPLLVDERTRA
jgi:hypothetical protein